MNMLAMTLHDLGASPWAWGAVAALALLALASLWRYLTCPVLAGRPAGDPAEARAWLNRRVTQGPRYLAVMLAAIAAMVAGLAMIARDLSPAFGFFLLVAGVAVAQIEPQRVRLRIATARVLAADDPDGRGAAQDDLRARHRTMVVVNVALVVAVALGLVAF